MFCPEFKIIKLFQTFAKVTAIEIVGGRHLVCMFACMYAVFYILLKFIEW